MPLVVQGDSTNHRARLPTNTCYRFNAAQPDGEYRKQMDASIKTQGHGAAAAELFQQVALLSPGAADYKTPEEHLFFSVLVCM